MSFDLASIRNRVEQLLEDTSNVKWDTDALDEAIRQALDAYAEHAPYRAIASITLTADGREIDISSLTYRTIDRVWWDYDATDPVYPPHWRDFQVWPGDLLYIVDDDEPAEDDVVRIWYTADHTIEDLNSATATTVPDRHESVLAQGAAGFAVVSRLVTVQEVSNVNEWAPRNMREWAQHQLQGFYLALEEIARRQAALSAGLATAPPLDRWDDTNRW